MACDENVQDILIKIFERRTGINFRDNKELANELLLGKPLYLPARELTLIYTDIVEHLHVEIPKEDVLEGHFNSYNNILKILEGKV